MAQSRRPRVRCRLPCELSRGRKRKRATVVSLSEGGLGVETEMPLEQGDPIGICIHPQRKEHAIRIEAIVWTAQRMRARSSGARRFLFGFVISDPPAPYLALFCELARNSPAAARRTRPARAVDASLPRPKDPLPPVKPEPEEQLPLFRVRVKQCDGPRTMVLPVNAESRNAAKQVAVCELSGDWEVLEVARE